MARTPGAAPPAAPASLLLIAERVEARVGALLDAEERRWQAVDPDLSELVRSLGDLVGSGGKRLRPAFCHWAYVGAGGDDLAAVTDAGAAYELLHAFAIVHDDVMDGSDRRRGQPTAHRRFDDRHVLGDWRGESRRFGEGVAILVGDLAFVYADMLLAGLDPDARQIWDELRVELNVGQYLDLLGTARAATDLSTARRIATYKTGKYSVERPLHLGAAMAQRLDDLAAPLTAYGLPLGEAYQLRDDLLGVFGDAELTGKPVGDDLREGKPTSLLAMARQRADSAGVALLARVGDPALDADEVGNMQDVLVASGAVAEIEERIAVLHDEAVGALTSAHLTEEASVALAELASYVAWRDQ